MTKNLIIIGAGQLGREVLMFVSDAIADGAPWRIKGFLDGRPDALNGFNVPVPILGSVRDYQPESDDVFVGAVGEPQEKVRGFKPILERGGRFVSLIHPLARVGRNTQIGEGVVLAPYAVVSCDLKVGNFVTVLPFSTLAHDVRVGDWCQISSHCGVNGCGEIGEGVFLGSHVCIIPQTKVGDWAYVGAGSVVIADVKPGSKVFGNPARPVHVPNRAEEPGLLDPCLKPETNR
jgi:sugar O-acyltransferase (sialic acid O-acetyltransferase NeuD family)